MTPFTRHTAGRMALQRSSPRTMVPRLIWPTDIFGPAEGSACAFALASDDLVGISSHGGSPRTEDDRSTPGRKFADNGLANPAAEAGDAYDAGLNVGHQFLLEDRVCHLRKR